VAYDPGNDTYKAANYLGLCVVLNVKDARLDDARRKELARSYATRMQALLRQAVSHGNKDAARRYQFWRDHLKNQARSYLALGDHAWLALTADDLAWWSYDPPNDTYAAACFLCRCVTLAGKDPRLDEARRKELARSYSDRALAMLRQAVARGYTDAAHMRQNPDLEPLRARAEFKMLLADLEGKTKE
jgi:hypothetical protein